MVQFFGITLYINTGLISGTQPWSSSNSSVINTMDFHLVDMGSTPIISHVSQWCHQKVHMTKTAPLLQERHTLHDARLSPCRLNS